MQCFKIIADNRERNLDILESLSGAGVELTFAQLPVGDYIISDRICVERKTVSDFESSIMNNRLFEQLDRLHSSFEKPMLIIEGGEEEHRLSENVVLGTILKLYVDHNVQVLRSRDASGTAAMLCKFAEREQTDEKKRPRLMGLKKAHTTYQWQVLMLSSVPGIGPSLADRLLLHFKTIKNISAANVDDLMKVEKIGKKKAQSIFNIINAEFSIDGAKA